MDGQEVSDRLAIHDLLAKYCHAIDQHRWTDLRALFADDARVDFTAFGGPRGDADMLIAFLQPVVEGLAGTYHSTTSVMCDLDGDRATVRSAAHVVMSSKGPNGGEQHNHVGLWYEDELARTDTGWCFARRTQKRAWVGAVAS
ncbi:nuclear transport factor 2 family protein [Sphingobium chungangianum]